MAAQIDGQKLVKVAEQIDRYVYDEALALFLCAPVRNTINSPLLTHKSASTLGLNG